MERLRLCIITPEGFFFDGGADMVVIRTTEGDIGVLPGHIPLTTLISSGRFALFDGGIRREGVLTGGFCEIIPDCVTVVVESVEWAG